MPIIAEPSRSVVFRSAVRLALACNNPAEAYRVADLGLADDSIDDETRAELSRVVEFLEAELHKRYPHPVAE